MNLNTQSQFLLGAVAYDPKVVTIWEGFKAYFEMQGLPFDFILYSNYERQVQAHLSGDFHVAWNSPLAWIEVERIARAHGKTAKAVAMRDTDQDLKSLLLVRSNSGIESVADLRGRKVAVGAQDSPQATLIPLMHLAEQGLEPGKDFQVQHHDLLVGKHGDHIGGEREAARSLVAGSCDAACVLDGNYLAFSQEGTLPTGAVKVLEQTAPFDHCNFTIIEEDAGAQQVELFTRLLLDMSYADAEVRPLLDLEGLKQWQPGRVSGYAMLDKAVDQFGYARDWMAGLSK